MTDKTNGTETVAEMSAEEKGSFASGITAEEAKEDPPAEAENTGIEINDVIEERCPAA